MKVALNLLTLVDNPLLANVGDVYFNIVSKNLRIYNGSTWIELTPPSTDPTPFYMHTHTFDGDVHTIDVQNQITFKDINSQDGSAVVLPLVKGYDGGGPSSLNDQADISIGNADVDDNLNLGNDQILEGGSSVDDGGTIVDGGSSL